MDFQFEEFRNLCPKELAAGCSVIICCHNSSSRLPKTLFHVATQKIQHNQPWEVLLIDNASTDLTALVAEQAWQRLGSPAPLRIILEKKHGLSNARRAGVLEAKYDVIVFCDDDNRLSAGYLDCAIRIMNAHPEVGVAGGRHSVICENDIDVPDWFYSYANSFAVGVQALRSGDITFRGYVWGAGMVLRASFLRKMYERDLQPLLTGRLREQISSGDDSEICKWYILGGYSLWYDEDLRLSHYMPISRLTPDYLLRLHEGFRASSRVLKAYDLFIARRLALSGFKRFPFRWLKAELAFWRYSRDFYFYLVRAEKLARFSRQALS